MSGQVARSEETAEALAELVRAQGTAVGSDSRMVEAYLSDLVPGASGAIAALSAAAGVGVPRDLLNADKASRMLFGQLVSRLIEQKSLSEPAASWAVEAWARALGVAGIQGADSGLESVEPAGSSRSGSVREASQPDESDRVEAQETRYADEGRGLPAENAKTTIEPPTTVASEDGASDRYRPINPSWLLWALALLGVAVALAANGLPGVAVPAAASGLFCLLVFVKSQT